MSRVPQGASTKSDLPKNVEALAGPLQTEDVDRKTLRQDEQDLQDGKRERDQE
jgi:hypothetical protein